MPDVPTTDRATATIVPASPDLDPDDTPWVKEAGELKEAHLDRLATIAPPLVDIDAYVEEFGRTVVPAYRRGIADRELPADAGLARSLIPPGTAAVRDFSRLAPRIPDLLAEKCVGCMACVSACPDTAILGVVVPEPELDGRIEAFAAGAPDRTTAARTARSHFADTQKYGEVPTRKGHARGQFGIFVDPVHCKGCAECVEVCSALGHDALVMIDKVAEEPATGESTLERFERDIRFFRSLPPTPPEYRNEKALADLMLGEHAIGYVGGAGSCAGCGEATAVRMLVAATRQVHGPESMGIVAATGCNTVFGSTYPFNPYLVPWTNSLFENAPAVALGIRARWDASGHPERRLWVMGGDGAMYDIGFQSLSRMVASGADIKVIVLDTQVYSNTGGQASTATFGGQVTKLSAYGKALHGRPERRKELARILMAHGEVYVAQTTPAHLNHFYRAIMDANEYPGPAVVVVYTPCQPEHGIADDASTRQAKLAVESRAFPLFTYDPRRGESLAARLSLQGNPALKDDWARAPDGSTIDFLAFARTEGRFAQHFGRDGSETPEILATQEDRLANWRTLQELAGIR
ncbi:MAG TPA: thiamine pyrophosphate-dependent enzyme [Candidatus Sulfomarinibacteraceae bacterium]|nr:thiamine pyrophosphate-dependent enzyme [Candidatus Sulfomarinibacteraceae bacterium]